ncbi:hypothetical protein HXX76_001060 [Chlamydomonas incerta]|uniref:HELP domain-containing protein n=1 Tax=Chlamydomonas incerta TaxID=51695 RepID=A0A835WBD9_CHLIN|nr:hypothetical protein HXX76_001060 [Chlamydomonas incerta]|eukprot:KAG2444303.1 hypothetical protein HXX76_001060 [Chlamydomonas incerta]
MDRILKASYGDRDQRELNAVARAPSARALEVQAGYRERRAANPRQEVPPPPGGGGPLFWDPKAQGTPYGLHNAYRSPAKGARVEIRPGVFHVVDSPGAAAGSPAPGGGGGGGRPSSAPPGRGRAVGAAAGAGGGGGGGVVGGVGPAPSTVALLPKVAELEEVMRDALRRAAAVHIKERTVLLRAFATELGKRHPELGPRDKVTQAQFASVWSRFGLALPPALTAAFFDKYGRDARGLMPVLNFTEALLMGGPRLDMAAAEGGRVQKGAYVAGKPATHTGKILYPECKKGVWPPSNWDPRLAERSAALPDVRLALEFVHGYDGHISTAPNIFYTAGGEVVYNTAGVGVVYNKAQHTQRFFLGHDDDILCTAIHPDRTTVATGQLGKSPCVCVWDSVTCRQISKLPFSRDDRGIQALAFSPDGTRLAAIATDNSHCLHLWDWARARPLCEPRKSQPGAPPAVYGVVWSKYEPDRLVTYGQNHIKFWRLGPDPRNPALVSPISEAGMYSLGKTHTVTGAVFLRSGVVLTGNEAGCICTWKGVRLSRETQAHGAGPPTRRPDGKPSHGGVRALVLQTDGVLLSGGADGAVHVWDVSSGDLGPLLRRFPLLRPDQVGTTAPPAIRGLDCAPDIPEMFVAGVASCDVWEVDKDPEVLVYGQQADLYGLATNPAFPHVYATCCDSDSVTVWSSVTRKPIRIVSLGGLVARGCAFSPSGQQLAVGCANGGIKVLEFHPAVRQVWWGKTFSSSVDELKYSPCGRYLAAGSHDQFIDIFDVTRGYARVCRCVGHSSTVRHIDWAADSSALQSVDQAYEVLYFDPRTGKQHKGNQRDTAWAGWSCLLGFPVMGIWFPDSDGTDINSVHASPSGRYVLTADDLGHVRLLNFPCVVGGAPAHVYGGHCSHVMNVRWAADESYAVSVGGKDRAVFQWRVVRQTARERHTVEAPWDKKDDKGLIWAAPPSASPPPPQQQYSAPNAGGGGGGGGSPAPPWARAGAAAGAGAGAGANGRGFGGGGGGGGGGAAAGEYAGGMSPGMRGAAAAAMGQRRAASAQRRR